MAYKDGEVFKTYCDKPYDQNHYRIIWKDGSTTDYDNYEIMRYLWYQYKDKAERVIIIDPKKTKTRGGKGF